jgi:hypothetical protein
MPAIVPSRISNSLVMYLISSGASRISLQNVCTFRMPSIAWAATLAIPIPEATAPDTSAVSFPGNSGFVCVVEVWNRRVLRCGRH